MTSKRLHRGLILLLAFAAYAPTLRLGFIFDDHLLIEHNPFLAHWSLANLAHDFTGDIFNHHGSPYYRPLLTLFDHLDYTLWGLQPFGYHLTSLLFHAGCGLLLYELMLGLAFAPLASLLTAGLFVIHPISADLMIHIAACGEQMSWFFTFLSLVLLLRKRPLAQAGGNLAYLLALLSKESAVITPALLALMLYYKKAPKKEYRKLIPLVTISALYLVWRNHLMGSILSGVGPELVGRFFLQAFPKVLSSYVRLLIAPVPLYFFRMMPHLSHVWPLYLLIWVGLIATLAVQGERLGLFCVLWFILALLPKSPVMITDSSMFEHWVYGAAIGVFLPIALMLSRWLNHPDSRLRAGGRALCAAGGLALVTLVYFNIAVRGTDESMYRWTLRHEDFRLAAFNLGVLLLDSGRAQEAVPFFQKLYERNPDDLDAGNGLAMAYWRTHNRNMALHLTEQLARRKPGYSMTERNLQQMRKELGQ